MQLPSPIQQLEDPLLKKAGVRLLLKRDDCIHPHLSGNKWRKLQYNLIAAREQGQDRLLSFGGAYSNHIAALAAAALAFDFKSIGLVRGEPTLPLNPTLQFARSCGMELHFLDRSTYRRKDDADQIEKWQTRYGPAYLIPEGGTNALALQGCAELVPEVLSQLGQLPDSFLLSCGTGGTLAGLVQGLNGQSRVLGFSALKGDFMPATIRHLLQNPSLTNWQINTDFHFGGYAKFQPPLIDFINWFYQQHQVLLDPIYTGKMLFGTYQLLKKGYFERGTTLLAIHTGGIQGIAGFNERHGQLIN